MTGWIRKKMEAFVHRVVVDDFDRYHKRLLEIEKKLGEAASELKIELRQVQTQAHPCLGCGTMMYVNHRGANLVEIGGKEAHQAISCGNCLPAIKRRGYRKVVVSIPEGHAPHPKGDSV